MRVSRRAVAENRAAEGRGAELTGLEDVEQDAVRVIRFGPFELDASDFSEDQLLRFPERKERPDRRGFQVDCGIALGPVGVVDARSGPLGEDEIEFLRKQCTLLGGEAVVEDISKTRAPAGNITRRDIEQTGWEAVGEGRFEIGAGAVDEGLGINFIPPRLNQ